LFELSNSYFKNLSEIREEAKKLPIDGFEPKNTFLTIHSKELKEVYNIAKRYPNLQCMYVGGEAFDIQLKTVSKGKALRKLIKMMSLKKENVIGIGDSVNDIEMLKECGIPVSADIKKIRCEYYTLEENILPGEIFINNILSRRLINFNL
jgi:HAD superfamily hydrolase (TIGR01484 family)